MKYKIRQFSPLGDAKFTKYNEYNCNSWLGSWILYAIARLTAGIGNKCDRIVIPQFYISTPLFVQIRNDKEYYFDSKGNTISELFENAFITEIDKSGTTMKGYHLEEARAPVSTAAHKILRNKLYLRRNW